MSELDHHTPEEPASTIESIVGTMFSRLRIIAVDMEKLQKAKEKLEHMQRRNTFFHLLGQDDDGSIYRAGSDMQVLRSKYSLISEVNKKSDEVSEEDVDFEDLSEDLCLLPFEEDRWHGYFKGFQVLTTPQAPDPNENSKCIELTAMLNCEQELKSCLLNGVRCFLIDLSVGTQHDNQSLIVKLREAEISVSKELGFPVASSVMAKLSPRHQFTGGFSTQFRQDGKTSVDLEQGKQIVLSVDRDYSDRCNEDVVYVNARFLIPDVQQFDFILVGEEIQLMVRSVHADHLKCCVARGGVLFAHMPVLFPARCRRFRISYEELEDLTFAREVGLNVVVSHIVGTSQYLDDLEHAMAVMHCDGMRLYARVVLNEIRGCKGELNWATKRYDGFLVELAEPAIMPDIMHLCPDAECFMQLAHASKKPIIFDPRLIDEQKLRVDPAHYYYTFFYPDKYVVSWSPQPKVTGYFRFLQSAIFQQICPQALAVTPYCDRSHTGADSLARAVATASLEIRAVSIVVIGVTTRMVQKIAHFRPQAPILFVSHMRSAEDYVSMYHNVTMLPFRSKCLVGHRRNVFRKAIYGLAYLVTRKLAQQNDPVILVYNHEEGTSFPEKYVVYKLDKTHFASHMAEILFTVDHDQKAQTLKDIEAI
ncbi:uncharacterized protein LOC128259694 [Drosophila gunungcola]|uniref:Pyruvate kinase n=1 Tax=Drosophila gunungcola TaxID=103775 RepID=A0A9P9YJG6_9MUSC|nr:uncharacterized protein LOC128259694 [Drosophila gunungcola]KAI8037936.1 hypothetical protein M5D96_009437 [Drosophila gunungcola]